VSSYLGQSDLKVGRESSPYVSPMKKERSRSRVNVVSNKYFPILLLVATVIFLPYQTLSNENNSTTGRVFKRTTSTGERTNTPNTVAFRG